MINNNIMRIKSISIVFALCMTFASCGNSNKTQAGSDHTSDVDLSEATIVVEDDSCEVDSVYNNSIVARGGTASEGFGRCLQRGCNCKSFEGRGQTCRNCGHA